MHAALHAGRLIRFRGPANTVKVVVDGNSINAGGQNGAESVGGVMGWMKRNLAPFSSQAYANVSIGGQNTDAMRSAAADVVAAFDATKSCVLLVMELTNQLGSTSDTAAVAVQKLLDYVTERRAANAWDAVVLATAPPVWLRDEYTQEQTDAYNARMDEANALLRLRWREVADALIETRQPGGPFDPARWPNYLRATFFDTTVVNGYSNHQLFTDESGTGFTHIRIHYSVAGITAMAPIFAATLLRTRAR